MQINSENLQPMHSTLVENAMINHDKNKIKYNKFLSSIDSYYFMNTTNDLEHNKITFTDYDGNEIFTSRYEILGTYNNYIKTFIWAWAINTYHKNTTAISKKILNYGFNLLISDDGYFFRNSLINSKLYFSNNVHLDFHIGLSSYLSKQPLIFENYYYPTNDNVTVVREDDTVKNVRKRLLNQKSDIYYVSYIMLLDYDNLPKKYL